MADVRAPPSTARTGTGWIALLGAAILLTAYTVTTAAVPSLRMKAFSPDLRIATEVFELCIVLFTALVLAFPDEHDIAPARNAFVVALIAVGLSTFALLVNGLDIVHAGLGIEPRLVFYPWVAARYLAGLMFIAAILDRPRLTKGMAMSIAGAAIALSVAVPALLGGRLPTSLIAFPGIPGGWVVQVTSTPENILVAFFPALLFAVGGWLAVRVYDRTASGIYLWLALALCAQVFSKIHETLYPSILGPVLTSVDVLRALSIVLLLVGALLRVRRLMRDRRAAVEAQAADLRAQGDLVASLREFAEREEMFRSIVVHELVTPIATIEAFSHVLDRHTNLDTSPVAREALAGLSGESSRLRALVERMDELRHLQLEAFECARETVTVRPILEQAARYVQGLPGDHTAVITCAQDLHAHADPVRLAQALRNLLTNAATYAPAHSPIMMECDLAGGMAHLAVEDRGPGIPPDERDRILHRYERGSTAQKQPGTGLGLYVASRIAEAHGGRLYFADPNGIRGARVVLAVPAVVPPQEGSGGPVPAATDIR